MRGLALLTAIGVLAACNEAAPPPEPEATDIPEELQTEAPAVITPPDGETAEGTPLEDRVATIGLLNKRNNETRDLELRPGEQQRIGNVIVRLASCERTAPWEMPKETGAFVQVFVSDARPGRDSAEVRWNRIFSGWLFKNSPSLNVVEHPIYDVWVKDCAMSFPGEEST